VPFRLPSGVAVAGSPPAKRPRLTVGVACACRSQGLPGRALLPGSGGRAPGQPRLLCILN
jgi:hypothetical protein